MWRVKKCSNEICIDGETNKILKIRTQDNWIPEVQKQELF